MVLKPLFILALAVNTVSNTIPDILGAAKGFFRDGSKFVLGSSLTPAPQGREFGPTAFAKRNLKCAPLASNF